ncbi:MAG: amidase [Rhodobacteraceae bacterium]|nr:amidase [Paracoccaceae bacterium]
MSEIVAWTATETVARLKSKEVSAVEVTQAHLDRAATVNPDLNALTQLCEDALDQARAIDAGQRPAGILHGAPVTTKVNTDQTGLVSTNGLPGLAQNVAPSDAPVVANLRDAGGVIVGRTNTPEFSMRWFTSNPLHGVTLNPWDTTATPGGSSGGASSALAAGVGVIAHGNDLGGSVRYPAFCCGIAGLRPSLGRIPAFNPTAPTERAPMTAAMSVQGPLGRSVADVQLGLDAMRGFRPDDPNWTAAQASGRPRRDGKIRMAFAHDAFATATHPALQDAVSRAEAAAQEAGIEVVHKTLPDLEGIARLWGQLLGTETRLTMETSVDELGSDDVKIWLNTMSNRYGTLDLAGYVQGIAQRTTYQRAWMRLFMDVDFVVLPTSLAPPFDNDQDFTSPSQATDILDAQKPLYIVNLLGLPALALPTHVADGRPVGVQIVGPMHDDDAVLGVGRLLERGLGSVLDQMPAPYRLL